MKNLMQMDDLPQTPGIKNVTVDKRAEANSFCPFVLPILYKTEEQST